MASVHTEPLEIAVAFDAWYDPEGAVWIAESTTARFGICTDAESREALARKLETMVADAAEVLFGRLPTRIVLTLRWAVPESAAA